MTNSTAAVTSSRDDEETFALVAEQLYTAVIGDILDTLGRRHQFLPAGIAPIERRMVLVGRAMPVLIQDVFDEPHEPFGRLTEALDQLRPGEIYVAHGGRTPCAAWGEIMTTAALVRGARGAVIDGYHRDTKRVLDLPFPVFSRGGYSQDAGARSVVTHVRVPVEIGDVRIEPGDLLVGDCDGVVVIPVALESQVLELALAKVDTEHQVRASIGEGMSATQAHARFGVL